MEINHAQAQQTVLFLLGKNIRLTTEEIKNDLYVWLKTLRLDEIIVEEIAANYTKHKIKEYMDYLPQQEKGFIDKWIESIDSFDYFNHKDLLTESYEEYVRVNSRVVADKKIDINPDLIGEDKIRLRHIDFNNIDINKTNLFIDNIFTLYNDEINMILGRQEFEPSIKFLHEQVKNVKQVKTSEVFLPQPQNILIDQNDIVRLKINELSNFSHKEYPNIEYVFAYKVASVGQRLMLTPIINIQRFRRPLPQLASLSMSFWLQNLKLEFNPIRKVGTVTFGFPVIITSVAHGLNTGDKITINDYSNPFFNSTFLVTVIDANNFSINRAIITGSLQVTFYVLKNKIEFNLELTWMPDFIKKG